MRIGVPHVYSAVFFFFFIFPWPRVPFAMWILLKGTKERARRAGVHTVRTRLFRTAQKVRIWHDVGKDIRNIWPFVQSCF